MSEQSTRTTICRETGCGLAVTNAGYCPAHVRNNSETRYDKARASDATRKMYNSVRYRRFREFLLVRNPICQRIENGIRCHRPSSVLHHLIDPDTPGGLDKFLLAENCCMVCPGHHPGGQPGTNWLVNIDYVPTFAGFGVLGQSSSGQQF
jgi:hypothetical protein